MTEAAPSIRRATPDDALPMRNLFRRGDVSEFTHRLGRGRPECGTTYYVVELAGEVAAVFALTELGRLHPGSAPQLLLHEIKLKPNFRGRNVPKDVFAWLAGTVGAGRDVDLIVLGPRVENPPLMINLGMVKAYHAFKWAASASGGVP